MLFRLGEGEEDLGKGRMENFNGEFLQVVVEGVGDEEVQDWSRQQGEGGMKGQAKQSRKIVWACSEVLELGECDVMEELDKELAGDILLIGRESFDGNENGRGRDNKDEKGVGT